MQSSEALDVAAQVAVTLAGFAGIVVVFRPQSVHEWSSLDRLRLRLLLMNSALPLGFALLGILLLSVDPPPVSIWRWCSGLSFAAEILVFVFMRNPRRRMSAADLSLVNKPIFFGIVVIVTAAIALQVVNFAVWNRFWPFFAVIFVHLIGAIVQFLRLVVLPPHTSADS